MQLYITRSTRFFLLWVLCPLIALASFRFLFGGVAVMMPDFLYHAEIRPLAFYSHIVFASVALGLLPFQFSSRLRQRRLATHRLLGRIYGASIMAGGLGGFWLALNTESGAVAGWGFGYLAIAWVCATAWAIALARAGEIKAHRRWMIRSAALTMAAVMLRLQLGTAALLGFSYDEIVAVIAWSCWLPNLVIAELVIHWPRRKT